MPNYIQFISPETFRSKYNPIVGIHKDYLPVFNNHFLNPLFIKLAETIGIHNNALEYLNIEDLITEKEFENLKNLELAKPYFYEIIFSNIFKNEQLRIRNKVKFTFTYDKELCPIEKNGVRYGVMSLGTKPVFYYCYIDIQHVIEFIKTLN